MRNLPLPLFLTFLSFCFCLSLRAIDSKGAIIIASMEGQVTVTNNESGADLPSDRIKVGGLLFDGHTIETGVDSKVVLLFSSGTISTLKAESSLNIKKFRQESFDPKISGKISDQKEEPSPSVTVINLDLGDMVVDVKKLNKDSSFNIDSPVGTAGIRGTVPAIKVVRLPDGGFNQTTSMLRGEIAFTPKTGGLPTMLGPGQSLSIGIGPTGLMLPMNIGRVDATVMNSIQADLDQVNEALGVSGPNQDSPNQQQVDGEEDGPSQDEINESDSDRQASAKGVDDNGSEAVALEKAGILDLDDSDKKEKVDTYVEVSKKAADKFDEKIQERRSGRRNDRRAKTDDEFLGDLVGNFDDVVDVTKQAEDIGIKDDQMFDSLLESSENAGAVKQVVQKASDIGVTADAENMGSLFTNVDQADSVVKVLDAAEENVADTKENGASLLGPVIRSADQASKLADVVAQTDSGDIDKSKRLGSLLTVVGKVDAKKTASKQNQASQQALGNNIDQDLKTAFEAIQLGETANYNGKSYSGIKGIDKLLEVSGVDLDQVDNLSNTDPLYALAFFASGIKDELSVSSSFENITDVVELSEAAQDLGLDDAALDNMLAYSDQASELNEVVSTAKESGASANLDAVLSNPDNAQDMKKLSDKASELAGDGVVDPELLDNLFANAESSDDLSEVIDATDGLEGVNVSNLLENADKGTELKKLKDEVEKIQQSGDVQSAQDLLRNVATNADKADVLSEVVDSANISGTSGSVKALISNADQADAFKAAKDKAESEGGGKVATLFQVIDKVDSKNKQTADEGGDSTTNGFDSLDALVDVADTLSDGGNLDDLAVFDDILDDIESVEQISIALEEDADLLNTLKNSDGGDLDLKSAVKDSALSKLKEKFPAYVSQIDSYEDRASDLQLILRNPALSEDTSRQATFFDNLDKLDDLLTIGKVLSDDSSKVAIIFDNISSLNLSDVSSVSNDLKYHPEKLTSVYSDIGNISLYKDLLTMFLDDPVKLNRLFGHTNRISDIHNLSTTVFVGNDSQISLLFNNLDKIDDLVAISNRFEGTLRDTVLNQIKSLSFNFKNDSTKRNKIFQNPDQLTSLSDLLNRPYIRNDNNRVDIVFQYIDRADAFLEVLDDLRGPNGTGSFQILFDDTLNTLQNTGLAKLKADYDPKYHSIFDDNIEDAAKINATASKFKNNPSRLDKIFNNIDKLEDINKFANEFAGDEPRLNIFFNRFETELSRIKEFKKLSESAGLSGGQSLDSYDKEPRWLELAKLDFTFFENLVQAIPDAQTLNGLSMNGIDGYNLAIELQQIGLSASELADVIHDFFKNFPSADEGPGSSPPEDEQDRGFAELATLSFLENHQFSGVISSNLVVSSQTAMASSFFSDILDVFDALGVIGEDSSDIEPIIVYNNANSLPNDENLHDSNSDLQGGVLGGANLTFSSGNYDLVSLKHDNLLFAAKESLTISGQLLIEHSSSFESQLIFLSAGNLEFSPGTKIDYNGYSLGFGSFDTLNIINVDLHAVGEISARSLDSLILENVSMHSKSDTLNIELIASSQISLDNLQFNNAKKIAMHAQTLNLSNINFPAGSSVTLKSQYGGINGKYPNFNSSLLGRVNFLNNIKYAQNLIMNRATFDQHASGHLVIGQR